MMDPFEFASNDMSVSNTNDTHQAVQQQQQQLQTIASLNNEGISHLVRRNSREALRCFQRSLETISALMMFPLPVVRNDGKVASFEVVTHPIPMTVEEEESYFLCHEAVSFDTSAIQSHGDAEMASAMLLFNVSLASHQGAMQFHENEDAKLRSACSLYGACSQLILEIAAGAQDVAHGGIAFAFSVASLNNQAHILSRLLNGGQALASLAMLHLTDLIKSNTALLESSSCIITRNQLEEIQLNSVMLVVSCGVSVMVAAAA